MNQENSRSKISHQAEKNCRFKMGKLKSKYLIIDVLNYGCSFQESFNILYFSCQSLRTLYSENNPFLFNTSQVKPMQSLDVSMISHLPMNDPYLSPYEKYFNVEAFMDPRIRMLTNHEIIVTNEAQLIGALDFLLQKREYFNKLYIFEDRINYQVYKNITYLSEIKFDCLKMIQRLRYTGSVSLDFTLSEIDAEPTHYLM